MANWSSLGAGGIKSLVVIDRNVFPVLKLPIDVFISTIVSLYVTSIKMTFYIKLVIRENTWLG